MVTKITPLSAEVLKPLSLKTTLLTKQKITQGQELLSLGLGEFTPNTPQPIIRAASKALKEGKTKYSSPFGVDQLRSALVDVFQPNNPDLTIESLMVVPGVKQGLFLSLRMLLDPQDEILLISPSYLSYLPQIYLAQPQAMVKVVQINPKNFTFNLDDLAQAISSKTKLILLNSPHNPTGQFFSTDELSRLLQLCDKHGCYLLNDAVYHDLYFNPADQPVLPLSHERMISVFGFGKAYNMTGWRLGYVVASNTVIQQLAKANNHVNAHAATFSQYAAIEALRLPPSYLQRKRSLLESNVKFLKSSVSKTSKLSLIPPKAGMFAFVKLELEDVQSDNFTAALLEATNVVVNPGIVFGPQWDQYIRISLAASRKTFTTGIKRLIQFVESYS